MCKVTENCSSREGLLDFKDSGMDLGAPSWGEEPIQKKCALGAHNFSTMVQFENSFTNFVQSNNYYENSTINEQSFETLVNKMNMLVDKCFLLDENMQHSKRNNKQSMDNIRYHSIN